MFMWPYKEVTRDEFEKKKDEVEKIIANLGGVACNFDLPYENRIMSVYMGNKVTHISNRSVYKYRDTYFRVCELCFSKPFIVIECGDYEDLINNRMEDAEPFSYDLSEDMFVNEVQYALGIIPYPDK